MFPSATGAHCQAPLPFIWESPRGLPIDITRPRSTCSFRLPQPYSKYMYESADEIAAKICAVELNRPISKY